MNDPYYFTFEVVNYQELIPDDKYYISKFIKFKVSFTFVSHFPVIS